MKKIFIFFIALFLVVGVVIFIIFITRASIGLSSPTMTIEVDQTKALSIEYDGEVKWITSNPEVATVDHIGNVTGINVGTCYIKVKAGLSTEKSKVTVTKSLIMPEMHLEKDKYSIFSSTTEQINATIIYNENSVLTNLVYESTDASIASVSSFGLITGVSKGNASITIKARYKGHDLSSTIRVTVNDLLLELSETSINLVQKTLVGYDDLAEKQITINHAKNIEGEITNPSITWFSENSSVATVTPDGTIKAVDWGNCIVIATFNHNGKSTTAQIVVTVGAVLIDTDEIVTADLSYGNGTSSTMALNFEDGTQIDKNAITILLLNYEIELIVNGGKISKEGLDVGIYNCMVFTTEYNYEVDLEIIRS